MGLVSRQDQPELEHMPRAWGWSSIETVWGACVAWGLVFVLGTLPGVGALSAFSTLRPEDAGGDSSCCSTAQDYGSL